MRDDFGVSSKPTGLRRVEFYFQAAWMEGAVKKVLDVPVNVKESRQRVSSVKFSAVSSFKRLICGSATAEGSTSWAICATGSEPG